MEPHLFTYELQVQRLVLPLEIILRCNWRTSVFRYLEIFFKGQMFAIVRHKPHYLYLKVTSSVMLLAHLMIALYKQNHTEGNSDFRNVYHDRMRVRSLFNIKPDVICFSFSFIFLTQNIVFQFVLSYFFIFTICIKLNVPLDNFICKTKVYFFEGQLKSKVNYTSCH